MNQTIPCSSCLHEGYNDFVSHEQVDSDSSKESESSGRLRDDVDVDNGVENPGTNKNAK